ncbi:MAG: hypothetical protein AB1742_14730 [bacterium]
MPGLYGLAVMAWRRRQGADGKPRSGEASPLKTRWDDIN